MATISNAYLFKLRLVVARYGEMDHMRWWNTNGILGKYGSLALSRGFPKTHRFAQAKVAFAVAAQRCQEIYDPPNAYTLWHLPPEIEDQFQEHWHKWLDNLEQWEGFFKSIEEISGKELFDLLRKVQSLKSPAAPYWYHQRIHSASIRILGIEKRGTRFRTRSRYFRLSC